MLSYVQSISNNTSPSIISKTPNEIAYDFSPHKPLDLLSNPLLSITFQARSDVTDAISFALANQKVHYDRKHQLLFMKVGDWAVLRPHKDYSIPSSAGITKKLT